MARIIKLIMVMLSVGAGFSNPLQAQETSGAAPMRIDTHIHLYDTERPGSSVFLDPVKHKKIYYPHLEKDFLDIASPAGLDFAVVVEASKRREDNFWLMDIVNQSSSLLAFIANLDPRDEHYIGDLDRLSANKKFRGIRIRPEQPIDLGDDLVLEKLGELAKRGLVLEIRENAGPLAAIENIAKHYPDMPIIIDHMGGGKISQGKIVPSTWNNRLQKLAAIPNVYIKISMLYTLSGQNPAPTQPSFYREFIDQVVKAFGPKRVLYGSNWTLSEMRGSYADLVHIYDRYLEEQSVLTAYDLYYGNAIQAYGLKVE